MKRIRIFPTLNAEAVIRSCPCTPSASWLLYWAFIEMHGNIVIEVRLGGRLTSAARQMFSRLVEMRTLANPSC